MNRKEKALTPEVVELVEQALVDRYEAARGLSTKETARLLGVSLSSVRRLIDAGELPHVRVGARQVVMQADAIAYMTSHRHGAVEAS